MTLSKLSVMSKVALERIPELGLAAKAVEDRSPRFASTKTKACKTVGP